MLDVIAFLALAAIVTLLLRHGPPVVNAMPRSTIRVPEFGWPMSIFGGLACALLAAAA